MLAALAASLTACDSEPELQAEPETIETSAAEVSENEAADYREEVAAADFRKIGPLVSRAPNDELRAEAEACRKKLAEGADSCATEE